MFLLYWLLLVG
ncbi:uncharacterized protein FFC1_01165 [Fusarium fujikuroi]|nr:uncharacterized protein FFC1_01165 [Fusarium fujikuroi]